MLTRLDKRRLGHQADDFGSGHAHAPGGRFRAYLVEGFVKRSLAHVGYIHRHLRNSILVDEPSDGLCSLERTGNHHHIAVGILDRFAGHLTPLTHGTSLLADIEGDGVGAACGSGVEIIIHRDKEIARSDCCGTGAGRILVVRAVSEIRTFPFMIHLFGKCLVFARAAYGEISAFGSECGRLIAICGYSEFIAYAPCESARELGALLECDSAHRNQRAHIGCSHTRMRSVMVAHVDKFRRLLDSTECRLADRFRLSDESYYGTVGGLSRIHVKQTHLSPFFNLSCDCVDYGAVAALAEIRHALYDLFH